MNKLIDSFGREIDYLRVSITDRCNMRCIYCMPPEGILHRPHSEILSFEEIHRIVNVAVRLGISKVRITGGEPLVRKGIALLIKNLRRINGLNEIALTTNGVYLKEYALSLKEAGLDRVNISLDSLMPEKFQEITRGGNLKSVLEGIDSGLSAGFSSLKINVVLMKAFNAQEVLDFANLARTRPLHVRFIEYMPTHLGEYTYKELFFSSLEARAILDSLGELVPIENNCGVSAAKSFRIKGFRGTIGFISPVSENFCSSCNKLRLTSDGCLRSCLHSPKSIDLKAAMKNGASDNDLAALIIKAVDSKPASHNLGTAPAGVPSEHFSMCQIGG
ncbi:MAG: cyclic pyranopterin phosphate synthase MoaA [Omnitrophica bacterium GWA2_41_15]|nr:MAG: cyclic pyranopterin phosphate synthase MoaA [Omnitrophica bacterium GWA2_41_15]HAZ10712.1 GTP 3',8-cyclase MoaA [Candidatus Omnitrophota bacterium]